jgi:osmotically-inducible protein OsmY
MFGSGIRDFDIHREVLSELDWSQDVHSTEVGVQVHSGVVTLSGVVSSPIKKSFAIDAAHRVEGVRAVVDAMVVHVPALDGVPDVDVAREAAVALDNLGRESVDHIRITVNRGYVTLGGQVRSRQARLEAERYLRNVRDITDVVNEISVVGADVDTRAIHSSIEHSFQSMAEQAARRISIEVDGNRLVLKGTVNTWSEREEAERAASGAGNLDVDNQIQVYPHIALESQHEQEELVYIAG